MLIATVRIGWVRSVSTDVVSRKIDITKDGVGLDTIEVGPEVSEYHLDIEATGSVQVKTTVIDSEGLQTVSDTYSFVIGDLVNPQPDTGFFHEILSVRDDAVPTP